MIRKSSQFALITLIIAVAFVVQSLPTFAGQDGPQPLGNIKINVQQVVDGLKGPTFVGNAGDSSGRIFIVEKSGRIRIFKDGQLAATPFLDISSIVNSSANERGLLSVAFHPDYKSNGLFYVYYTGSSGKITIARYQASSNTDVADPNSAKILLTVDH